MKHLLPFLFLLPSLTAQVDSRKAEIERARDEKAARLVPDIPNKWERRLIYIKDRKVLERLSAGVAGFRVKVGGMATGGGFALGPDYLREDLSRGRILLNAHAQASTRGWTKMLVQLGAPSIAADRLFWEIHALRHDYTSLPYYGPGPDSRKDDRSNYRLEDASFDTMFGVRPTRHLRIGASSGYLLVNTGPGQDDRFISADRKFTAIRVPGLDRQTDFYRWGVCARFDYRDSATGPRAGGNYTVRFDDYSDRRLSLHSFRRLDIDLQQYLPFFNKRRVIALRGRTLLNSPRTGHTVPFYQQAVLGGSDDLRGYRPYRFADDNLLVMNAEYRWEVFAGLDMAAFADAGKVFPRRGHLNFRDLESAVGFGFRFNVRNATFLRLDVGFSQEGFQVWFKFGDVFQQRPLRSSSSPHIY